MSRHERRGRCAIAIYTCLLLLLAVVVAWSASFGSLHQQLYGQPLRLPPATATAGHQDKGYTITPNSYQ